jgi:hypothetical protein
MAIPKYDDIYKEIFIVVSDSDIYSIDGPRRIFCSDRLV